jgi:hypothetical protein
VKALSLWQPWASLVALGVKTIETRSWSTSYRGPLAIHAARRPVREKVVIGAYEAWLPDEPGRPHPNHPDGRPARLYCNSPKTSFDLARWWPLPFGAVVATCTLVDVVPMKAHTEPTTDHAAHLMVGTRFDAGRLLLARPSEGFSGSGRSITTHFEWATDVVDDQRPYGDFAPGRYAWLLADVKPLAEPIPVRGRQGMWEWDR